MALRQSEIGERIAQLREQRGNPPQETVAHQLGVSYRAYQTWEAGDAKPSYPNLEKLAEYYGVSEEYILTGSDDPAAARRAEAGQLDRIETLVLENASRLEQLASAIDVLATSQMRVLLQAELDAQERTQADSSRSSKPRPGR